MKGLIVGAGISGLSMAIALEKIGIVPRIIEKARNLRSEGAGIALPLNAVESISYLGLKNELLNCAHIVNNIIYALPNGDVLSKAALADNFPSRYPFVALHRKDLIALLAKKISCNIEFGKKITEIQFENKISKVKFDNGECDNFDFVIGADGVHSELRSMLINTDIKKDLGISTWRFITHFKQNDPFYYFGKQSAFMIYPINDTQVYCYAHASDACRQSQATISDLSQIFSKYTAKITKLIHSIHHENIIFGRLFSLSESILRKSSVIFIGDAAHACSPMLQQGAATALEDCIAFTYFLKQFFDIEKSIYHYEAFRKPRVEWIRENSDNPLKSVSACMTNEEYEKRNQSIIKNGPINIMKWKTLFSEDYLASIARYLESAQ